MEVEGGVGGGRSADDRDVEKMGMGGPAAAAHDQAPPVNPHLPPMSTSTIVSPNVVNLVLRVATVVFLLIALIVIAVAKGEVYLNGFIYRIGPQDVYSYRYVISVTVIGSAYTLLQIAFTIYRLLMKKRLANENAMILFDFYADKVMSYFLVTGAAAGFGASIDASNIFTFYGLGNDSLFKSGNGASSLVLIAFLFSAASSIISSYALSNRRT